MRIGEKFNLEWESLEPLKTEGICQGCISSTAVISHVPSGLGERDWRTMGTANTGISLTQNETIKAGV